MIIIVLHHPRTRKRAETGFDDMEFIIQSVIFTGLSEEEEKEIMKRRINYNIVTGI